MRAGILDGLGRRDLVQDTGQAERVVGRRARRNHQLERLATHAEVLAQGVDQLDSGAVQVAELAEVEDHGMEMVAGVLGDRGPQELRIGDVDLADERGQEGRPVVDERDLRELYDATRFCSATRVPSSWARTSTSSITAFMIAIPRPRCWPRGSRHSP